MWPGVKPQGSQKIVKAMLIGVGLWMVRVKFPGKNGGLQLLGLIVAFPVGANVVD